MFTKPLRLGNQTMPRRKSDVTGPPPGAPPDEPLPPVPPSLRSMPSRDRFDAAKSPSLITSPSQGSCPLPVEPPRSPVFKMLPPVANASTASHSHNPSWVTPSALSHEYRDMELQQEPPPVFRVITDATERRRLQTELRVKPLTHSTYGRAIINLLTLPWVVAPSGLAACALGYGDDAGAASDVASYINMLVCGAEAFAAPYADILAVYHLTHLNRLLVKCGLSPIVPGPLPTPWYPLAARQPPEFLLEGFRMRNATSSRDSEGHA